MKKGYKNWREVERKTPIISEITADEENLYLTFNYIDSQHKSILSGKFTIHKKYIKDESEAKKLLFYKAGLIGTGTYSVLTTLALVLIIFFP